LPDEKTLLLRAKRQKEELELQVLRGELNRAKDIEAVMNHMLGNFRARFLGKIKNKGEKGMFGNKTLAQQVNEFLTQVREREQKIQDKIASLKKQDSEIKASIEEQTSNLVQYELADDLQGQEQCNKALRKLREKQIEIQELIAAYEKELGKGTHYDKDLQKIRIAAKKEWDNRVQQLAELRKERENIEEQIKRLQDKIEELRRDIADGTDPVVRSVRSIHRYIDPRTGKLSSYDVDRFIKAWINNEDTEEIFKRHEVV
jgi:chromosome segregation ATPase